MMMKTENNRSDTKALKKLARKLTYKADIYYPGVGRIYAFEGKFVVDAAGLMFVRNDTGHALPLVATRLTDGHGRTIT